MGTYLIFFGKSQDFTFYAFDNSKFVNDFGSIIKDFEELESKVFTVDDISNKEILSKYTFEKNGKSFSLLKLYSLGQAFNGSRISGSIYGVAILSENDVKISETNLAILKSAKKNFTSLCLDGLKFKSSDFFKEAESIWLAFINHSSGNYINKIDLNNKINNINNINSKIKGYYLKNLDDSKELNNETYNTSRLYVSEDLDHLKRTQLKWGKDMFPIYTKENNKYVLYIEKQVDQKSFKQINEIDILKIENDELKSEFERYDIEIQLLKKTSKRKLVIASVIAILLFLLNLGLLIKTNYYDKRNTIKNTELSISEKSNHQQIENLNEVSKLKDIIANDEKRKLLYNILVNLNELKNKSKNDSLKYITAIKRDANCLGLDTNNLKLK